MKTKKPNRQQLTKKKKLFFNFLAILFPLLIILVAELLLRAFSYGDNLNLFINHPEDSYSDYKMVNPEIGKKYFQKFEYTKPGNDIFLKKKPEDSFRIFVMGSSTVVGFPYGNNLMFSRILHQMLEDTYPGKKIEVINTAITAINSYTLLDFTDEILKYEPDAILLYAGHNEFYGAFGIGSNETMSRNMIITGLHLKCMNLRLYQFIRQIINGVAAKIAESRSSEVHGTLMKRIVKDKEILYNSADYRVAMDYFNENISVLLQKANKKDVPVFISELISNTKDLRPFNSVHNDSLEAAIDVYKSAQKALSDSNFIEAEKLFSKAKDLDCIRFRASEEVNNIIHDLAVKNNAFLIPMKKYFKEQSINGIIGNELMLEHVHPNYKGYFIMAKAFYDKILESKFISNDLDKSNVKTLNYYRSQYGYTNLDIRTGYHRVELLKHHWPFITDFSNTSDYRMLYKPKSKIDSMAFNIMKYKNISLENTHLTLAEKYESLNKHYDAYREYETIIRMNPYIAINYRKAAICLIQLSELPLALKHFEKSLIYEESFFALFKAGEIYLFKGDYESAFDKLKQAYNIAPKNKRSNVLYKLYLAAAYANKEAEAKQIATNLLKTNPGIKLDLPPKRNYYMDYIPVMIAADFEKAKKELANGNLDKALEILIASLNKWDSHVTNRYIGDILIQKKEFKKASFYYKKVKNDFNYDVKFLHNLLMLYMQENDISNAKNCLEKIKRIDPNYIGISQLEKFFKANNL